MAMMVMLFGDYAHAIATGFDFVMGRAHKAMGFAYLLMLMSMIVTSFQDKKFKFSENAEKMFAYTIFIMLGNVVDKLAVNAVFEWEGSTQFLICLFIVSKEATVVKNYLALKYGIDIPVLNERIEQLGRVGQRTRSADPDDLNSRISSLRRELGELEQKQEEEN